MPWDLGANLLAGVRTGLDIGQTQQTNALRQQAAAQSQYEMYRQAVKDAEARAGKIIQAALPMLDTTDDASLQRSWSAVMPKVMEQLNAQGLMNINPVATQVMGFHQGIMDGTLIPQVRPGIQRMQQMLGAGPQAPVRGTPEYMKAFEEEQKIKQEYATSKAPLPGTPEWKENKKFEASLKTKPEELGPETIEMLAQRFVITGEMPALGMGAAGTRVQILNRAGELMKEFGDTPEEQVARSAVMAGYRKELARLQTQRGPVLAFKKTTEKNMDILLRLSDKVNDAGIPVLNRWIRAGMKSIAGDPDVASFDAAMTTVINEYARVASSVTGAGVTSDQARKEIREILSHAATRRQIPAVVRVLKQEMQNRTEGYLEQQLATVNQMIDEAKSWKKKSATMTPETLEDPLGIR